MSMESQATEGPMLDMNETQSLAAFQRNARAQIRKLKKSGKAQVLTVNGRAEVVVQDARSYQRLLDLIDEAEAVAGIRRGLRSVERGEGITLKQFDARMRRRHGISRSR